MTSNTCMHAKGKGEEDDNRKFEVHDHDDVQDIYYICI